MSKNAALWGKFTSPNKLFLIFFPTLLHENVAKAITQDSRLCIRLQYVNLNSLFKHYPRKLKFTCPSALLYINKSLGQWNIGAGGQVL